MSVKPFTLAVKAVICDEQGRCLLIRRSACNKNFVGKWEWPGGKVDKGEDFATAVMREAAEETGLQVEIIGLAGAIEFEMPSIHVVLLSMEARITSGELRLSEEHDAHQWVPLANIGELDLIDGTVRDGMLAFARKRLAESH